MFCDGTGTFTSRFASSVCCFVFPTHIHTYVYVYISSNLYTYSFLDGEIIQNTDLWNMYLGMDWNKGLSTVTAMTLNTVDSSRVLEIDPSRIATLSKVRMNPAFSSWRIKRPDYQLSDIDI